jgi:two-component system, OmpR family, response regulator
MTGWKVLLVDDEPDFATTLAERLRLRGITATVASDGEEALRQVSENPPQLVVLDMMMPGLGGLGVLRQLKRDHPHLPVILLTGRSSTKDGIEGMRLGALDYLMKPLKIEELIEKMEQALAPQTSVEGQ